MYFVKHVLIIKKINPSVILHVRESLPIEHILLHAVRAKKKVIYRSFSISLNFINKYFSEHTYSDEMIPSKSMDQITCYADMYRRITGEDNLYKSKISHLPVISLSMKLPSQYILICPGASVDNKCWSVDNYIEVVDFILNNYSLNIVFCGTNEDNKIVRNIIRKLPRSMRIINYSGKTTIREWVFIIQNAKLVLTNESGSVHIAASSSVPSICIGEQKYGDKWLPYRVEYHSLIDVEPIIVRADKLPCFFCASTNFTYSEQCKQCYKREGTILCVHNVTPKMVIDKIKEVLYK